jgi:multiple sugar transport system substrate-binding protein
MSAQLQTAYNRPMIVYYNEFSQMLQVEIQNALAGKKTPQQALSDAQKHIAEIGN